MADPTHSTSQDSIPMRKLAINIFVNIVINVPHPMLIYALTKGLKILIQYNNYADHAYLSM